MFEVEMSLIRRFKLYIFTKYYIYYISFWVLVEFTIEVLVCLFFLTFYEKSANNVI